jgi:hypothetical protein
MAVFRAVSDSIALSDSRKRSPLFGGLQLISYSDIEFSISITSAFLTCSAVRNAVPHGPLDSLNGIDVRCGKSPCPQPGEIRCRDLDELPDRQPTDVDYGTR